MSGETGGTVEVLRMATLTEPQQGSRGVTLPQCPWEDKCADRGCRRLRDSEGDCTIAVTSDEGSRA